MSYKKFYEAVKTSLGLYREGLNPSIAAGKFKDSDNIPHILRIEEDDKTSKARITFQYNVLEAARIEPFKLEKKLHRYAHHLTSSQILCYNYFRPLMKGEKLVVPDKLAACISVLKNANVLESQFEYEQKTPKWYWLPKNATREEKEGTNFDFYVNTDKNEVFFEIKYTEQGFGNITDAEDKKKNGKYTDKYEHLYKKHLDDCIAIKNEKKAKIDKAVFFKYYQLFRNVIRIKSKNQYAVFIFPEENTKCESEFKEFIQFCNTENVIKIYWRELLDKTTKATGFDDKYFSFTINK
jgi:hypothetical protein